MLLKSSCNKFEDLDSIWCWSFQQFFLKSCDCYFQIWSHYFYKYSGCPEICASYKRITVVFETKMFSETYFKFSKNMDIIGGSKWALCERSILDVAAASDPSLDILSKRSNSYSLTLFFYRYFYLRKIYGGLEDLKWNKLKEKQMEVSIKSTIKYFNLILQLSPSLQLVSLLPKEFICSEAYIAVLFGFYNKGNNPHEILVIYTQI